MITISSEAKAKIEALLKEKNDASYFLRVAVKGGGCSGFSYVVELDNKKTEWDKPVGGEATQIICDQKSYVYLAGSELHYSDSLVGGGFHFRNPNASGSCGCGQSFSV